MEDESLVVAPAMDAVETTTETSSPDVEQTDTANADLNQAENPESPTEESKEADEPIAEKSKNRFQELVDTVKSKDERIAELEAQMAVNKPETDPAMSQKQNEIEEMKSWLDQYDANPQLQYDPIYAAQAANLERRLLKSDRELGEMRTQVESENRAFNDKVNQVIDIENNSELLKKVPGLKDELHDLVFNYEMDPKAAEQKLQKNYDLIASTSTTQALKTIADKNGQNSIKSSPSSSTPDFNKMSSSEMRSFLLEHPDVAAM